jgi:outer membrane protein assembly factor BamB
MISNTLSGLVFWVAEFVRIPKSQETFSKSAVFRCLTASATSTPPRFLSERSSSMHKWLTPFFSIAIGCASLFSAKMTGASDADSWPVSRGNAASQGISESKLPAKPRLLWTFSEPSTAFEATPAITNGQVFIGDLDGGAYALELETGNVIWRKKFEDGFSASPAYKDGHVIMGDYEGLVRCLDAATGETRWEFSTDAQIDGGANFYGELVLITSEDGGLYAINLKSGELVWKFATSDQLRVAPTIAGNKTFLGGCDGKLHVIDLDTGKEIGEGFPLQSPTGSTPAVAGDYVFAPTHSGNVFAINHATLQQEWLFSDAQRSQEIRSSPAISEGKLFVTTRNKRLLAIDIKTGKLAWEYVFKKRSEASPVVCDDRVWVGSGDGRLVSLKLATGEELWQSEQTGAFNASAAIAAGKLVIANDKGSVYCFGE